MRGWKTVKLADIAASVEYGVTASATQHQTGPKFLRITDIQNGKVDWENVPWCDCDSATAKKSRLEQGDIVFARTGATTGKSYRIEQCPKHTVFASYLIRVRLGSSAESRYVSHFFNTPQYWTQITQSARGVAQPGVNATTLKALRLPLPPLTEQRLIAEVLDKSEELRAKRRNALATLDSLAQSIFLEMFGDPVTNPKGWTQVKLVEAVNGKYGIKAGPFGSSLKKEDYTATGYRVYGQEQVIAGRFDIGDYCIGLKKFQQLRSCEVAEGDILVSLVGSYGKVLIVPKGIEPGIINPRLLKITPNCTLLTPIFLATVIESPTVQLEFERVSHGGTMGILNAGLLKQLRVPLPPLDLQRDFAHRIAAVEALKTAHRASLAELDALFASLQHRAFRGEL